MMKHRLLFYAAVLISAVTTSAFVSPQHSANIRNSCSKNFSIQRDVLKLRGGDTAINMSVSSISSATDALREALVSGSPLRGVAALYAVASLTVVPLTWYRAGYSFSVGYGLSIATMSLALLASFPLSGGGSLLSRFMSSPPTILAYTAAVYGLRLAAFIFARERSVESKKKVFDEIDAKQPSILKRTPLALGVSLLYAFMVSPALFALRGSVESGSLSQKVQIFFTGVAAFGMLLESIADQHKYEVYSNKKEGGEDKFIGPTTWSYKLCRHPNYLGEILHWVGLFGAGSVSFKKSITAWVCGGLGLWGILSIMFGASSRLDKKQSEKYGGQKGYEDWKVKVKSSVIPGLESSISLGGPK